MFLLSHFIIGQVGREMFLIITHTSLGYKVTLLIYEIIQKKPKESNFVLRGYLEKSFPLWCPTWPAALVSLVAFVENFAHCTSAISEYQFILNLVCHMSGIRHIFISVLNE